MIPKKRLMACLIAGLLSGCYAQSNGSDAADFSAQGVRSIAILPIVNETQVVAPEPAVYNALSYQLTHNKHFQVLPQAKTLALLRANHASYSNMLDLLALGNEVSPSLLTAVCAQLGVDALFLESLTLENQRMEPQSWPLLNGGIGAEQVPVSVVGLKGELFSARAQSVIWRHSYLTTSAPDPIKQGKAAIASVVAKATTGLLATFPVNTWTPTTTATPVVSPTP